jgi:hypothetical protein
MNLRQRMDEIRQLAEKASPAHRVVVDCNAVLALLNVVEQQREALSNLLVMLPSSDNDAPDTDRIPASFNYVRWLDIREARAALSLMDKEVK